MRLEKMPAPPNTLVEYAADGCHEKMGQLVVEAGGCLHVAQVVGGKFVVTLGRRAAPIHGVTRVWGWAFPTA